MMTDTDIPENLRRIQEKIHAAATLAGRRPAEITLIGVSKTHPASVIQAAIAAGLRHFGENRVQEWEGKRGAVENLAATWHLIGHLQSNKAAKAARLFHAVDSVDDFALAQRLDRARAEMPGADPRRLLVEVHMGEETKSGVSEAGLPALATQLLPLSHLNFAGLMVIPPFLDDPEAVRLSFAQLRHVRRAV